MKRLEKNHPAKTSVLNKRFNSLSGTLPDKKRVRSCGMGFATGGEMPLFSGQSTKNKKE
jgi:hypothetical protein